MNAFRKVIALLITLLIALPYATTRAGGHSSLPIVAQTQSHGIYVSLAMPHRAYAWNSFVPVTARVVNVSGHVVSVGYSEQGVSCFDKGPVVVVEVRRQVGTVVFPPSVPGAPALPCPGPAPASGATLRPGGAMTWNGYVILRAAHLVARVTLVQGTQSIDVTTPAVTVSPFSTPPPAVTLRTGAAVSATLTRPAHAHGPILAAWWWDCVTRATPRQSAAGESSRPGPVTPVQGTRLTPHLDPSCTRLNQWHAVAGWAGFPAASVDYVAPRT